MALKDMLSPHWLEKYKSSPRRVISPVFVIDETMSVDATGPITSVMLVPRPCDQLQIHISFATKMLPVIPVKFSKYADVLGPFLVTTCTNTGRPVSLTLNSALHYLADPANLPFQEIIAALGDPKRSLHWQSIFIELQPVINSFSPRAIDTLKSRLSLGLTEKHLQSTPPSKKTLAYLLTHPDKPTRELAIRWTSIHAPKLTVR